VSGSGISWAICKSAPRSREITLQQPTTHFFKGQMPFLPPNQLHQSTEGISLLEKFFSLLQKMEETRDEIDLHRFILKTAMQWKYQQ